MFVNNIETELPAVCKDCYMCGSEPTRGNKEKSICLLYIFFPTKKQTCKRQREKIPYKY